MTERATFTRRQVVVGAAGAGLSVRSSRAARPPNFVLIMADDLGYGDLGCYGQREIRTPNIDRLAAEGVRLASFTANPVCTPSRAALLTGRHPIRSGLTRVLFPQSTGGIEGETTVAELLRNRRYATACIGKWHLGHLPPFLPTRHGFDTFFGLPYSNDMQSEARRDPPLPLMLDERVVEAPATQETLTRRYTERAVQFIGEHRDRPFFIYLPHTMPHVPIHASPGFRGRSSAGLYGDVVEEIDWSVGEIAAAIDRAGIDNHTLLLFTSDNGPWLQQGRDGGGAGPLRAGKGTTYEGGIRVPFIARWPGRIPAGRTVDAPAANLDLLPTFCRLSGQTAPKDLVLDGRDISGLLTGRGRRADNRFLCYHAEQLQAIRDGDWKLHLPRTEQDRPRPGELYNLRQDPGEKNDLLAAESRRAERMLALARQLDAETRRGAKPLKT